MLSQLTEVFSLAIQNIRKSLNTDDSDINAQFRITQPGNISATDESLLTFLDKSLQNNHSRISLIRELDRMDDEVPEINAGLDLMADSVVYGQKSAVSGKDATYRVFVTRKDGKKLKKWEMKLINEANEELERDTKIKKELWSIARSTIKYGDNFEEIRMNKKYQVKQIFHLDLTTMEVKLDALGNLSDVPYIQYPNGFNHQEDRQKDICQSDVAMFPKEFVMHFSLKKDRRRCRIFGRSEIFPAIRIWKQVTYAEMSLLNQIIRRAHQRWVWFIDVGKAQGQAAMDLVEKWMAGIRRTNYIDRNTGTHRSFEMPNTSNKDIGIPSSPGGKADVKTIEGDKSINDTTAIEYFHAKYFTAMTIAKPFIPGSYSGVDQNHYLEFQDVQHVRKTRRIQNVFSEELVKPYKIQYISKGLKISEYDITIVFPIVGIIDELRRWQIERIKADIARTYALDLGIIDDEFIHDYYLGLDKNTSTELLQRISDKRDELLKTLGTEEPNGDEENSDTVPDNRGDSGVTKKDKSNPKRVAIMRKREEQLAILEELIESSSIDDRIKQAIMRIKELNDLEAEYNGSVVNG